MLEFDIATLIIFVFGVFGCKFEPWSPHPKMMVLFGLVYFGLKCAFFTVALMKDYLHTQKRIEKKRRNKNYV